jgi:predicted glycoside hydrolase/deacetylase ChbG (UPF0249 family)
MTRAGEGLLIVNADDLGLREEITEATLGCWDAGAITSATAMVFMADSERAAGLADARGLPVGLHLNLTSPFDSPTVPPAVAARQARVVEHFQVARRRWLPAPRMRAAIAASITDQLEEFRRLYARAPTHADGHQHIQRCPAVFGSAALRPVGRLRITHTFSPDERPPVQRLARAGVNAAIRRRFVGVERFWSLVDLHPELGGSGLEARLLETARLSAEIMVHPVYPEEGRVLRSPEWAAAIGGRRLGSYADLPGAPAQVAADAIVS